MCLILIAWRGHAEFPCVIAANRDEYHARPAARADWWAKTPAILAGRDLAGGGTWLGITRQGRFAALTNFRQPPRRSGAPPSRGALVSEFLASGASVAQALEHLHAVGERYNGFNMMFSDGRTLGVYESEAVAGRELPPGIYGLSNHLLDTPWPKVVNAKSRLSLALQRLPAVEPMLALLRDANPAPDAELPDTGVNLEWERLLSSAFIRGADYGTRCSTLVRIDRHGSVCFDEWTWDTTGAESARSSFAFTLG
jgi:uncharacterized protein with NRDE domain